MRIAQLLQDMIESEVVLLVLSIVKFLVLLIVVNHFLCTGWYAIGVSYKESGHPNWIDEYNVWDRSFGYRYTTALHWSLTQFTPASINMQPTNEGERVYGIFLLVGGLMVFSSFTGSITSAITQLRDMHSSRSRQFWLLK